MEKVPDAEIPWNYDTPPEDVIALDTALTRLEKEDAEGYRLVLLRYYAGVTVPEAAQLTGSSVRTVERKWRFLHAWLARELDAPAAG